MEQSRLDRINELYKKQKEVGLSEAEKEEQAKLRKEYVASITKNFRGTLNNIKIQDESGNIRPLKRKNK